MHGPDMQISSRRLRRRQNSAVDRMRDVTITGETIRLGQLLKLAGIVDSGGEGKALIERGVLVNGEAVRVA